MNKKFKIVIYKVFLNALLCVVSHGGRSSANVFARSLPFTAGDRNTRQRGYRHTNRVSHKRWNGTLAAAIEWILSRQHEASAWEASGEGKRRENRRYQDNVLALSRAFALASASHEAQNVRDEIAFFQAVVSPN